MHEEIFKCDVHAGRMTGDARREQILTTAIRLFSQYGFSGTTTKKIAEAAGVSEAMVFRHFARKSDIYNAILDNKQCHDGMRFPWEENTILQDAIAKGDDHAVFYNLALNALTKQQADEPFMRLLFYSALEAHELADRFFNEFVERIYEFIGGYIERRQEEGAMREINPRIVVRAFMGMMIHHSLNNILWDKQRRILDITNEEAAKNFAEIILHGVARD
ncbi:MAG TPA: TetR/AcrR family transcriptional regulator [Pyrinomonadaceae bacterium]|nr:TetR/AcrR family transcriptional regulator [Pyrinomonadaceae bacterium]